MRKNRKNLLGVLIAVAVVVLVISGAVAFIIFSFLNNTEGGNGEIVLEPNTEEISFFDHPNHAHLDPARLHIVLGDTIKGLPQGALLIEGELYLPANFLRQFVDNHIFWEESSGRLTITNMDEVKRFYPNQNTYTVNWTPRPLAAPIRQVGPMAFLPAAMVTENYPVDITLHDEYGFVIIDFHKSQRLIYDVPRGTLLRFGPSDQFPIMAHLHPGDRLVFFGEYGDYLRVRLENGLVGYAYSQDLYFADYVAAVAEIEQRRPITRAPQGPINLVWHQLSLHNPASWYAPPGVNVISPAWFSFDDTAMNGDIVSLAGHAYVQWAQANGLEVWPKITDNHSLPVARMVLTNTANRDHAIAQIMNFISTYNLDGINVNFESHLGAYAEYWIQFLRELAVPMRQAQKVLSVAVKVPEPWNLFWNHGEIARTVDFVAIMAYDEHYRTADTAGPVSSFDFVRRNIQTSLNMLPAEQLIVGLPTYVNIWREEFVDGEWQLADASARQVGMNYARIIIESRGGTFFWDYHVRQYVGEVEFEENGTQMRLRVWLEDLRSMREKLSLFTRYNLAGVAFWQKGLELPEMWGVVNEVLER